MVSEVFSHRVCVESIDEGTAVARLESELASAAAASEPAAILALAHHSSQAAVRGLVRSICGEVSWAPAESRFTHLRTPSGALSAAALIECEHIDDVTADIHRTGNVRTRVNVAVVDDEGETIALGSFDYVIRNIVQRAS